MEIKNELDEKDISNLWDQDGNPAVYCTLRRNGDHQH